MTKLRAHQNVIDLAEARREREQQQLVHFVGWCTEPASGPHVAANQRHVAAGGSRSSPGAPDMLTAVEIEALKQKAKANSAFYRKAFANLTLENGKVVEVPAETVPEPPKSRVGWLRRIFRS